MPYGSSWSWWTASHVPLRVFVAASCLACAACAEETDDPATVNRDDMYDGSGTSGGVVATTSSSSAANGSADGGTSGSGEHPPSPSSSSSEDSNDSPDASDEASDEADPPGASSDDTTSTLPETGDSGQESEGSLPSESSRYQVARPIGSTEANAGYWEYLPPSYGTEPLPLLVALHGIDENGEGSASTLPDVLVNGVPMLIARDRWPTERAFVVLSPQFTGEYCPDPRWVATFLEYAIGNYEIDPDRVYLTGLSCGAYGVWNYLAAYLDQHVAAAVPIAGDGQSAWTQAGCDLGRVPIWAFHGDDDTRVEPIGTLLPVGNLQQCELLPRDLRITTYLGVGHDSWSRTYDLTAGHDIYTWMLSHVRGP